MVFSPIYTCYPLSLNQFNILVIYTYIDSIEVNLCLNGPELVLLNQYQRTSVSNSL
jgi:hypothetical protein